MPEALISILIPVYNREEIIKKTLDSIHAQTYANWECILVDDGSTDASENTIASYSLKDSRFKYFKRPNTLVKGANSCRNHAYSICQGEFVNWFDSDDIMMPNFLETKIRTFKSTTHGVMHRNRYSNYDLTRFRDSRFKHSGAQSLFYHYALDQIEIQTSAFMWRNAYLKDKPLFKDDMQRYQDNEFHIRMLSIKPEIEIIDTVLATIRGGGGDDSQISAKINLTDKKLYDIFFYRYQCFKLASTVLDGKKQSEVKKVTAKKALWSFYDMIRIQKTSKSRFNSIKEHASKLNDLYLSDEFTAFDTLKSKLYLKYLGLFGSSKYSN